MDRDDEEMLRYLGCEDIDALFTDIPKEVMIDGLDIPPGIPEMELLPLVREILSKDTAASSVASFLGAGIYDHYVPAAVRAIVSRSEFLTSYTPYQPEISQGMLQALFEFQSLISELTGMEAVNSSMYDCATAIAEAALMACRVTGRHEFIVPRGMWWERKDVLRNYCDAAGIKIREYPWERSSGRGALDDLQITDDTAGLYIETPNLFGVLEDMRGLKERLGTALLVVGVNPVTLALLKPPSEYGADIVVGEGQPLGIGMNFGGPTLGLFACRKEYVRKMPGRIVGLTSDVEGRRGFCLVLQTREQHIRRHKATSNICTNHALSALQAAAYISLMGSDGLRKVAMASMESAHLLAEELRALEGYKVPLFSGPFFNEFMIQSPINAQDLVRAALRHNVYAGVPLSSLSEQWLLVSCTERSSPEKRRALLHALRSAGNGI
ncbi:MAG: aminomethyl-transferring glycine dehydrogenase subunit GcvPA [Candidatus Thermoplasmatota archaeon]